MSDLSGQIWPQPAVIKIISFIYSMNISHKRSTHTCFTVYLLTDIAPSLSRETVSPSLSVTSQPSDGLVGILIENGFNEINL